MGEDIYWRKYAGRFRTFPKLIPVEIDPDVKMVICIPACAEPDVISTLQSISHCEFEGFKVEVIVLFNKNSLMSVQEIDQHNRSWAQCSAWVCRYRSDKIRFIPIYVDELPDAKGGVGWARKISMDEAARRLDGNGIIVCLDADCTVSINYVDAIFQHFQEFKTCDAASIFIEHEIDQVKGKHRDAIIQYELHLRYLVNAQRWSGHPFAFHTIGSAMAVKRRPYLEQGGMNTRRAGEDFYFLQKFIEVGTHMVIRNTTVFPSARISYRVPFGTGKAMQQILEDQEQWVTTDFEIFNRIKPLFQSLDKLRSLALKSYNGEGYLILQNEMGLTPEVIEFLRQIEFLEECQEVATHTASLSTFRRRFFRYFNSFRMIKYMHYMSDHHFPDVMVIEGVSKLVKEMNLSVPPGQNGSAYLNLFRHLDRETR